MPARYRSCAAEAGFHRRARVVVKCHFGERILSVMEGISTWGPTNENRKTLRISQPLARTGERGAGTRRRERRRVKVPVPQDLNRVLDDINSAGAGKKTRSAAVVAHIDNSEVPRYLPTTSVAVPS